MSGYSRSGRFWNDSAPNATSIRLMTAANTGRRTETSDRIIGRSLYWRGDFDFQKFEAANRLLREHWVVGPDAPLPVLIDVGANVGSICIPAVKRELVNRCIAIEPDPENFRLLKVNAALNGVDDRIDTRQMAVGATSDRVSVLLESVAGGYFIEGQQ